jgi:hypothetical protein
MVQNGTDLITLLVNNNLMADANLLGRSGLHSSRPLAVEKAKTICPRALAGKARKIGDLMFNES